MASSSKRPKTAFQQSWLLQYGIEVSEVHPGTKVVQSAACRFCKYFGRKPANMDVRKRHPTAKIKYFMSPWRADMIAQHVKDQHSEKWMEYSAADNSAKQLFFGSLIARSNTLHNYMDLDADAVTFNVSHEIVDIVIGQLLFRDDDELAAARDDEQDELVAANRASKVSKLKHNAMSLFIQQEDGTYRAVIKNVARFRLAIAHVSAGLSFRQAAAVMDQTRSLLNQAKLSGITDHMVGKFIRVLVGAAIQKIGDVLGRRDVWAFGLSFDGSTHRGTTFCDVRVHLAPRGVL
jgi:hypothetical protein